MKFLPIFLLLTFYSGTSLLFAQLPQSINYQAVVRDGETGGELQNQSVEVIFSILDGGADGSSVYEEMHNAETNEFGLINLQIGEGAMMAGAFNEIDWGSGPKWLKVEMAMGDGFEEISNSQFISVPYALHAEFAETATNVDDADADPSNELIDSLALNENVLEVYEAGSVFTIDLSDLISDADDDPTNELIEEGSFQLIDTLLVFTEGGITQEVNLAALANYGPWQVGPGTVYNTNDLIGIGTEEPEHKLHVLNEGDEDSVAVFVSGAATGGSNTGLYARASGATENRAVFGDAPGVSGTNWAGYFDRGNVKVSNRLAVGTAGTDAQLKISGTEEDLPILDAETTTGESALRVAGTGRVGVGETDPHSHFQVKGSVAGKVQFVDSGVLDVINLTEEDYMLIVNVTIGAVTVNLPPAESCAGRVYYIKRTFNLPTANTLAISPAIGDSIDGTVLPILLSSISNKESRMLVSAGSQGWFIMSE